MTGRMTIQSSLAALLLVVIRSSDSASGCGWRTYHQKILPIRQAIPGSTSHDQSIMLSSPSVCKNRCAHSPSCAALSVWLARGQGFICKVVDNVTEPLVDHPDGIVYAKDDFPILLTRAFNITCEASSTEIPELTCDNAYDDVIMYGYWNEWASNQETDGLWITLTFPQAVYIVTAKIYFRCCNCCQFKVVEFESVDHATKRTLSRRCNGQDFWSQCDGQGPESFSLTLGPVTSLTMTGREACCEEKENGGFREIQLFGF